MKASDLLINFKLLVSEVSTQPGKTLPTSAGSGTKLIEPPQARTPVTPVPNLNTIYQPNISGLGKPFVNPDQILICVYIVKNDINVVSNLNLPWPLGFCDLYRFKPLIFTVTVTGVSVCPRHVTNVNLV